MRGEIKTTLLSGGTEVKTGKDGNFIQGLCFSCQLDSS
jgi:hypothetical protein